MKKLIWIATVLMAGALVVPAQQGQGGNPRAFGDKDKDGICDLTGKPVGQGRAAMQAGNAQRRAFGDKDKDGICDVTGKPVGQGQAAMRAGKGQRQGMGRGRGRGHHGKGHHGRGMRGQGMQGRGMQGQQGTAGAQAPAEKPAETSK